MLGGVIVGDKKLINEIYLFVRNTGPALSPFNAWVLLKGLETLAVRVRAQTETAAKIADALASADEAIALQPQLVAAHAVDDLRRGARGSRRSKTP